MSKVRLSSNVFQPRAFASAQQRQGDVQCRADLASARDVADICKRRKLSPRKLLTCWLQLVLLPLNFASVVGLSAVKQHVSLVPLFFSLSLCLALAECSETNK